VWPVVAGVVIGAVLMGRTKPRAASRKRELIGPTTGNTYVVDDFPQSNLIIVHGIQCVCVFVKNQNRPGFSFVNAKGNPEGVRQVCMDLEPALLQAPQGETHE
jgi:hypothetical protein